MGIERYTSQPHSLWMDAGAPGQDVVLSSRIRLARNLARVPFPHLADRDQKLQVIQRVAEVIPHLDKQAGELGWEMLRVDETPPVERFVLVDKHLISPQFAQADGPSAVVLRHDEGVSIMVNEEDHLRIQALSPGLQLQEAWSLASEVDNVIEASLDYAYSPELGYLTACPTNVGTGIRASVMVHLPALVITGKIDKILSAIGQVGLVARGMYGEGTQAHGSIFQISNQITLGQSEQEIIENITGVTKQIIEQERAARRALQNGAAIELHDRVGRACGVLANARKMSSQEAMQLLSDIRLGLCLQLINGLDHATIHEMLVITHPAWLNHAVGRDLDPNERDIKRAAALRERMAGVSC